ncbi:MAG: DUF3014 domain-containing protein [Porticoccaceae bacterium]
MARPPNKSGTSKIILLLGTIAAGALVGGILYQALNNTDQNDMAVMGIVEDQPVVQAVIERPPVPEAVIPEPAPIEVAEPPPEAQEQVVKTQPKLPLLDNSDNFLRDRMLLIKHKPELQTWLNADDLVRRSASYLDGLARGNTLSKIFPLTAPEGSFAMHSDGDIIWLNAGNYERYNATVAVLTSFDMQSLGQIFHFIRPLLETAFAEMGYRPRQMDGIILQSIDNVLATPIIVEPIELTRDSVAYKFADPELEALLPIQKQLLRTGPENTQRLQQQALLLKEALLNP